MGAFAVGKEENDRRVNGSMRVQANDERWMAEALAEARKAWGRTHPNPAVGALVVHAGAVVGRGHTAPAGGPHAEVRALEGWRAHGAPLDAGTTLYVTLEPCSTHGRTAPCVDAILDAGLRRVVVGATDPNPAHAGRAFDLLGAGGVEVVSGVLAGECADLNLIFNHSIRTGRPFVAAKYAMTVDGCVATRSGASKWITGEAARADVARWRRYFPAIGVGAGTLTADNPRLTARIPGQPVWCPRRFVFDRSFRLRTRAPRELNVFSDAYADRTTLVVRADHGEAARSWLGPSDATVRAFSGDAFLPSFLDHLADAGITGLFVEGGPGLWTDFWRADAIDYLFAYRAPVLLGDAHGRRPFSGRAVDSMGGAVRLGSVKIADFAGGDQLLRGSLRS